MKKEKHFGGTTLNDFFVNFLRKRQILGKKRNMLHLGKANHSQVMV